MLQEGANNFLDQINLFGGKEWGSVLKIYILSLLAICWSGPSVGGVLWLFWCLLMELVECLWDLVGHRQTNCNVYVFPIQGETQFF